MNRYQVKRHVKHHVKRLTYKQWLKLRHHTRKHHKKHISWLASERKKYHQFTYKHRRAIATTKTVGRGTIIVGRATGRGIAASYKYVRKEAPIVTHRIKSAAQRFSGFIGRERTAYQRWKYKRQLSKSGIKTYMLQKAYDDD